MKKGFTLVEIMIVVAIIGLLAAIVIPNWQKAKYHKPAEEMNMTTEDYMKYLDELKKKEKRERRYLKELEKEQALRNKKLGILK